MIALPFLAGVLCGAFLMAVRSAWADRASGRNAETLDPLTLARAVERDR